MSNGIYMHLLSTEFLVIQRHFPAAKCVATSNVAEGTKQHLGPGCLELWHQLFQGGQCGDVVYDDCYQFFREANTTEKRKKWIGSLDIIAAVQPHIVVPGHKRASQADGSYLIEATRAYILTLEEELEGTKDAEELEKAISGLSFPVGFNGTDGNLGVARYPQRWNLLFMERSCQSSVETPHKS